MPKLIFAFLYIERTRFRSSIFVYFLIQLVLFLKSKDSERSQPGMPRFQFHARQNQLRLNKARTPRKCGQRRAEGHLFSSHHKGHQAESVQMGACVQFGQLLPQCGQRLQKSAQVLPESLRAVPELGNLWPGAG